jgi:hypothetical protein
MSVVFWDNSQAVAGDLIGPGAEGPLYASNEWDTCRIQGMHLPGIVDVVVNSKPRRTHQRKSNGSDGSTPTFRGLDPAKLTVRIVIWTPDQLSLMDAMLPILFPNPNKDVNKLSSLDISHPITQHRGIKSIIVEDIEGPAPGPVRGSKQYTLKCEEYIAVTTKSAVRTPVGSVAVTPAFQPPPGKNNPKPPSQTDAGPNPAPSPQGGSS